MEERIRYDSSPPFHLTLTSSYSYVIDTVCLGDMVYLENLGRPLIFINSYEIAVDLFEKRSANYSSRPSFPMVNDLYVLTRCFICFICGANVDT